MLCCLVAYVRICTNAYIYNSYYISCSCFSIVKLNPEVQIYSDYDVSLNGMAFKYTSMKNFTKYLDNLIIAARYIPQFSSSSCLFYSAVFVYNHLFIPCNLTTGTPRPLCSKACYMFSNECEYEYTTMITYANLIGIPIENGCENAFGHINSIFNYPNTSKDYENDCYDFPGI